MEGSFQGGLVFKAHRRVYHSILGLRVIKKKQVEGSPAWRLWLLSETRPIWRARVKGVWSSVYGIQGYLTRKKTPSPLGPP